MELREKVLQKAKEIGIDKIRKDFSSISKSEYIYLDNSATTQVPDCVIDNVAEMYKKGVGNPHSLMNNMAEKGMAIIEGTRKKIANFLHAKESEIVFVKSATEGLNLVIQGVMNKYYNMGDEIVTSIEEHHANLVPYQEALKSKKMYEKIDDYIQIVYLDEKNRFSYEDLEEKVSNRTKILGITYTSNVLGEEISLKKIREILSKKNISPIIVLDLSQAVSHTKIDVKKLDVDFAVFSGHKMYSTFGAGVVYMKEKYITEIPPLLYGGDMIEYVYEKDATYLKDVKKFEAGTQDVGAIYALGKAIDYITSIGVDKIGSYLSLLTKYLQQRLLSLGWVNIISNKDAKGLVSFTVDGIHSHDIATILGSAKICIRAGNHCAMPLHKYIKIVSTTRVSMGIYNTVDEIDRLIEQLKIAKEIFS